MSTVDLSREGSLELPRIDYGRRNTRDYAYAYFTGGDTGWIDRLVKVDVRDGTRSEWHDDGCYPGEPIFVPREGAGERSGYLLTLVYDARAHRSHVAVIDAERFEDGPIARAHFEHHVPFGFHGTWAPAI